MSGVQIFTMFASCVVGGAVIAWLLTHMGSTE